MKYPDATHDLFSPDIALDAVELLDVGMFELVVLDLGSSPELLTAY